ncbi:hypothetical protein [Candidatus Methylacidithermus pantelleriae]|uniref:Uncharacterized protein n=1 Tax=Candidatus Methylacidithermus pantelleriae TaxID=2744239 RepID=A0A8J2BH56_9BACT|nr:hypothetical protein [Candidatus Methylacidithermus pantelleriae]CAF0689193.1 hypothetical protein MPNT_10141 [Candidatus Methylacidithermus pantelleriae]
MFSVTEALWDSLGAFAFVLVIHADFRAHAHLPVPLSVAIGTDLLDIHAYNLQELSFLL